MLLNHDDCSIRIALIDKYLIANMKIFIQEKIFSINAKFIARNRRIFFIRRLSNYNRCKLFFIHHTDAEFITESEESYFEGVPNDVYSEGIKKLTNRWSHIVSTYIRRLEQYLNLVGSIWPKKKRNLLVHFHFH